MSKYLIITCVVEDSRGCKHLICDHAVDIDTLEDRVLPPESPKSVADYYSNELGG